MPHFIIDCSPAVLKMQKADTILRAVYGEADKTGLFRKADIKSRLRSFEHFTTGGKSDDFIHVFGWIMEGRTAEQKSNLSRHIVLRLKELFPSVPVISMNVADIEKAGYTNLESLDKK